MTNYYCLVAGLPDLSLEDGKLNYTVANFKSEIYSELSEKDRKLIDLFYLKFDNANLLKLLKDKEATTDFEGNYSQNELLALISSVREGDAPDKRYPSYLYEFITAYLALSAEELYRAEDMLSACYYAYAMNCGNQFVSSWFEFNLNINNILAALAARKYKMDVSQVVVGKTDVSEMIRTSNARDFGLSEMLEYFEQVLRISEIEELVEREKKIDLLKWNWMEDAVFFSLSTSSSISLIRSIGSKYSSISVNPKSRAFDVRIISLTSVFPTTTWDTSILYLRAASAASILLIFRLNSNQEEIN